MGALTATDGFLASTATRNDGRRSVKYEWEVGTLPAGDGYGERKVLAVLSIHHSKAGPNYYTGEYTTEDYFGVTLSNVKVETRDGGAFDSYSVRSFMVGAGVGLGRVPAGNRYSAKKLREAASAGYCMFREYVEAGDERVLKYLADGGAADG